MALNDKSQLIIKQPFRLLCHFTSLKNAIVFYLHNPQFLIFNSSFLIYITIFAV